MASTTVEKASLNAVERDWLKTMGAALEVDLNADSAGAAATAQPANADGAAGDAGLEAKCNQIKAAVIPKIKEALAADPTKKEEITRLLDAASKQEKKASFGDAFITFKTLVETVKTAIGSAGNFVKYQMMLPGAELKVKTLKGHRQTEAIKDDIATVEAVLAKAKEHAAKSEYAEACTQLEKLDADYKRAKAIADAIASMREFEEARRTEVNNLKQHQGVDYIKGDLQAIEDKVTQLDVLIKGRKWGDFSTLNSDILDDIRHFKGIANKHGDIVGLQNNALMQVRALEAHPNKNAVKTEIAAIKKLIDDGKKEYKKGYEKAREILIQIEPMYVAAKTKADSGGQAAFQKEFDAVNLKLKELEKPEKKNPIVDGEIAAVKAKLASAEKYAGTMQFPEAMKLLAAAKTDIEAAEKLAAQQVALGGAQKAAGDATSKIDTDAQAAVAAVQKLHDQVKTHPQAKAIQFELGEAQKSIDQAKVALA